MSETLIDREQFTQRLIAWLVKYRQDLDPATVTWEADLIDTRIIDSLMFVEFVLFLEDIVGADFGDALNSINNFRTPARIYETVSKLKQSSQSGGNAAAAVLPSCA